MEMFIYYIANSVLIDCLKIIKMINVFVITIGALQILQSVVCVLFYYFKMHDIPINLHFNRIFITPETFEDNTRI